MASEEKDHPATRYTIHIANNISPGWEIWFDGMELSQTTQGETILTGDLADQSALFGLLEKIHSLNLSLLSVQRSEACVNQEEQDARRSETIEKTE